MGITASDVNKLRKASGAGMMDCKKALEEANGNFDDAILVLRKKGQKVSEKRADREAKEGLVIARINDNSTEGIIVAINSETDFVAKNDDFVAFANKIADAAEQGKPADLDGLKAIEIDGRSIADHLTDYTGKIGERIDISNYRLVKGDSVVPYIHSNKKLGVLVQMNKNVSDAIKAAGRDVGMQIASMNPVALSKDDVDPAIVQREIELGKEKALKEGKPENIVEKIAMGMLNKFYKENTLLEQAFVKDGSQTIATMLNGVESGLSVVRFERIQLG